MDGAQIAVTVAGVAIIGFILWFFFGPRTATFARATGSGPQEVRIEVRGAYSPDRIAVEVGRPVRLTFERREENPCTAQVIFPDLGIVKDLPVGRPVAVEFTPEKPGELTFHCGMNMVRGKILVADAKWPGGPQPAPSGSPVGHH
jgi:plastocyanin domain-containing protein